jgi:cobalt-zinc-cadmium efflux system outer membrane protein
MRSRSLFSVLMLSVCAGSPSGAEAASSVNELVAEALQTNPELKFYEAEIAAAKGGSKLARLRAAPELSAEIGQKSVDGDANAEGLAWSASLVQPFEWPGRIGLRKAIANHDVELANLGYERFKIALASQVRMRAFDLFAAQEKASAAMEVAERFKALREVLVQRDPAGLTPLLERRVIEATELNARRAASEAELTAKATLLELNQLRGLPADTELVVEATAPTFNALESRERLIGLARTNNLELRIREVELAQQGFRVELSRNERWSAISVGPTISEEDAGERERVIGLAVSLPLSTGGRNAGNVETARARQAQAETSLLVAQRDVERRVIAAALTYESKVKAMADWRPDSVQQFKEAAELADRHYRLGAVPVATYVELQKEYLGAVESLLDTKREALGAAAEIELLTGLSESLVATPAAGSPK